MNPVYGPNTKQVRACLAKLQQLTPKQLDTVKAVYKKLEHEGAWKRADRAALYTADRLGLSHSAAEAAMDAARAIGGLGPIEAFIAARAAAHAIVIRQGLTPEDFDTLTAPMRAVGVTFDDHPTPETQPPSATPEPDLHPTSRHGLHDLITTLLARAWEQGWTAAAHEGEEAQNPYTDPDYTW